MEKKLEHLFKAVELLDVDIIGWFIPENFLINNTGKEMLVRKIEDVSSIFKQFNNTQLNIRFQRLNPQKLGIAFVIWGNTSKHFISFTINKINDFEYAYEVCPVDTYFEHLQLDERFRIDINYFKDEVIDFQPNMKYFKENELYEELIHELESASNNNLDLDEIESWLECASEAYENLTPYRLQFRNCFIFYKNYNTLLDILALIELDVTILEAIELYEDLNKNEDKEQCLATWCEDFYWLNEELEAFNRYAYLINPNSDKLKLSGLYNISVNNTELLNAIKFMEIYKDVSSKLKLSV